MTAAPLPALDWVVLIPETTGKLRVSGTAPAWLPKVWPATANRGFLDPSQASPFLESFLIEAHAFWRTQAPGRLDSGTWQEVDPGGGEIELVATAVTVDAQPILVVQRCSDGRSNPADRSKNEAVPIPHTDHRFSTYVSHRIHTPMEGLLGRLKHVLHSSLGAEQRSQLESAQQSAEDLLASIQNLLDQSRIEADQLELKAEDFRLRHELDDALQPLLVRARRRGIELTRYVAPTVPDGVNGDPGRLRQVLLNLVGNALKFTRHGSVHVTVNAGKIAPLPTGASASEIPEYEMLVTVSDTGIGIAPERLPHLFSTLPHAHGGLASDVGGTGLGLMLCQQWVTRMGGTIQVRSQPGGGSEFSFNVRLKLAPRTTANTEAMAPIPPDSGAFQPSTGRPLKILVADDHPVNREVAAAFLQRLGHPSPAFAENGRDALDQIRQTEFDLVLMDVQMPEMDGLAATRELRRREDAAGTPRLPVIALTSHVGKTDQAACLAAGMDDFLSKPVRCAALEKALSANVSTPPNPPPAPVPAESSLTPELHELLRTTTYEGLTGLCHALTRRDARVGIHTAHFLRGGLAILGDSTLAAMAGSVEEALKQGDFPGAIARTEQLTDAVRHYFSNRL